MCISIEVLILNARNYSIELEMHRIEQMTSTPSPIARSLSIHIDLNVRLQSATHWWSLIIHRYNLWRILDELSARACDLNKLIVRARRVTLKTKIDANIKIHAIFAFFKTLWNENNPIFSHQR